MEKQIAPSTLRSRMAVRGFSDEALAVALGLKDVRIIDDWKHGRKRPSRKQIERICGLLETNPEQMCIRDVNKRLTASQSNDQTPSSICPSTESVSASEAVSPAPRDVTPRFSWAEAVITKLLNGQVVSPELRNELLLTARGSWLLDATEERTLESLAINVDQRIEAERQAAKPQQPDIKTKEEEFCSLENNILDNPTANVVPEAA